MPENDNTPIAAQLDAEKAPAAPKAPAQPASPQAKAESPAPAAAPVAKQDAAAPASDSSAKPVQTAPAKEDVVVESAPEKADPEADAAKAQFPSLKGEPEVEVFERSPDNHEGPTSKFVKSFVVLGEIGTDDQPTKDLHENNKLVVLEEAIQRGMHPQGEATFVGKSEQRARRGQVSTELTYEVEVVPAVIDDDANSAVTPAHVLDDDQK